MVKKMTVLCFLILCMPFIAAAGDEIPFAIGEWSPFTGRTLQEYGMASEIVSVVCEKAGITPKYTFYPWKRAEHHVMQGKAFATFPFRKTKEREKSFLFSDPVIKSAIGILRYKGDAGDGFKFESPEDVKGYKVGLTTGDAHTQQLLDNGARVEATELIDQSIKKLRSGRLDLVVEERIVTFDAVKRLFPGEIENFSFHEKNFQDGLSWGVMISRKYPDSTSIMRKFNEGLKTIREDGSLEKIYKKYGL